MRILVVDDHQLFVDGVRYILSRLDEKMEAVEATSAADAVRLLESDPDFDLVLIDVHMPGLGGIQLLHHLRDRGIWLPVVVISGDTDRGTITRCINAGALGFIPKSYGAAEMLAALQHVLDGETYVPDGIVLSEENVADVGGDAEITHRQFQVLRLLALGYSNRKIADTLFITEHTVKAHVNALFRVLAVSNRTECVRIAEDRGLLSS